MDIICVAASPRGSDSPGGIGHRATTVASASMPIVEEQQQQHQPRHCGAFATTSSAPATAMSMEDEEQH
jgi:hypothetical protein